MDGTDVSRRPLFSGLAAAGLPAALLFVLLAALPGRARAADEPALGRQEQDAAMAAIRRAREGDNNAWGEALHRLEAARRHYTAAGAQTEIENATALIFWTRKMMPMNVQTDAAVSELPPEQPTAELERQAQQAYDRADRFMRNHPDEHFIAMARFFEVAERYQGTPASLAAQRESMNALKRVMAGANNPTPTKPTPAKPPPTVPTRRPVGVPGGAGLIVVEAEEPSESLPRGSWSWKEERREAGFGGSGYMCALPAGDEIAGPGYTERAPELRYRVRFAQAGTYYVWARMLARSYSDNTVYLGLDGRPLPGGTALQAPRDGRWVWTASLRGGAAPLSLSILVAGEHTLHLWMRDDGARIDALLLAPDAKYRPEGIVLPPAATPTAAPSPTAGDETVAEPAGGGAGYAERDGRVVFEAERPSRIIDRGNIRWVFRDRYLNFSGEGLVRPLPKTADIFQDNYVGRVSELQYEVDFAEAGTYYVWARLAADDTSEDTIHVGLDGAGVETGRRLAVPNPGGGNGWQWCGATGDNGRARLAVPSAGRHVFNLWIRETSIKVDKFILTRDEGFQPDGPGPPATGSGGRRVPGDGAPRPGPGGGHGGGPGGGGGGLLKSRIDAGG